MGFLQTRGVKDGDYKPQWTKKGHDYGVTIYQLETNPEKRSQAAAEWTPGKGWTYHEEVLRELSPSLTLEVCKAHEL